MWDFLQSHSAQIAFSSWQHVSLVAQCLVLATILAVGIAAVAAYVLGPGLGGFIFSGLSRLGGANSLESVLTGVIGVVILAPVLDLVLVGLGRLTTPRGIRV